MSVDTTDFTQALARVPGPVTVVTTVSPSGQSWGFTASSFSSLSLSPPLVLVCLDKAASTHQAFLEADRFLINVLSEEQSDVALRFAKSGTDRFAAGDMAPCELGLPGLPRASARLACSTHDIADGGDHSILIGRAEAAHTGGGMPLVYCDRTFARPAPADPALAAR
ncbi:flavin reductase family protein [Streptomyces sp. NPDC050619]|uniref:flavin reductase family protein n=1 Tax=Streptomyces sp. NPDC050619 TaxID=3157214 RepID=UPI00341A11FD